MSHHYSKGEFQRIMNRPVKEEVEERPFNNLARLLLASLLADRLGISHDTALRKYTPETPSEFWQNLAKHLSRCIAETIGKKLSPFEELS